MRSRRNSQIFNGCGFRGSDTSVLRERTPRRESLNAWTLRSDESLVKTTAPDSPQISIKQPRPFQGRTRTKQPRLRFATASNGTPPPTGGGQGTNDQRSSCLPGEGTTNVDKVVVDADTEDKQAISIKEANADAAARSIRFFASEIIKY